MLKTRLLYGTILVLALAGILAIDHFTNTIYGFTALLFIIAALALYEFYTMHEVKLQTKLPKIYGIITGLLIIIGVILESRDGLANFVDLIFIFSFIVSLGLLCLMVWYVAKGMPSSINNAYIIISGIIYIVFPLLVLYFIRTIMAFDDPFGERLVLYLIIINKVADTAAYFGGTYLGRHKLAPTVSPNKSAEGLTCALVAGLLCGFAFWYFTGLRGSWSLSYSFIMSFIIALSGQIGDLIESLIKRYCGVKDSAALFPALGGVLDLIDCLLVSAPVMILFVKISSLLFIR